MSRSFADAGVPPTVPDLTEALARAAAIAGSAPSIHNTQPWRWQVGDAALDLYLAPERRLAHTHPPGRLAGISCGAPPPPPRPPPAREGAPGPGGAVPPPPPPP